MVVGNTITFLPAYTPMMFSPLIIADLDIHSQSTRPWLKTNVYILSVRHAAYHNTSGSDWKIFT